MFQQAIHILNPLMDLFFPRFCIGCDVKGEFFCQGCADRAAKSFSRSEAFPVARPIVEDGEGELDRLIVAMNYEDIVVRRVVKTFKYAFAQDLAERLAGVLMGALGRAIPGKEVMVTYVPLHENRKKWRGFNQAEVLAEGLAGGEVGRLLKRVRETKAQAELRRLERFENVKGAFEVKEGAVVGERVVIVDDVSTTGATLSECAGVLKRAGAREVIGLVLAKRK